MKVESRNRVCIAMMRDYVCSKRWSGWRDVTDHRRYVTLDLLASFLTHGICVSFKTLVIFSTHTGNPANKPMFLVLLFRSWDPEVVSRHHHLDCSGQQTVFPLNFLHVTCLHISARQRVTIRNAIANFGPVRLRQVRKREPGPGFPGPVFMHTHKSLGHGTWVQWNGRPYELDPLEKQWDRLGKVENSGDLDMIPC